MKRALRHKPLKSLSAGTESSETEYAAILIFRNEYLWTFSLSFEFYRKSSSKPKLDFSNAGKPLYDTIWNKTDACSTFGNLAESNDEQTIVHPMIEYLYKWKEDRANWKFKKAKQVFWTFFLCDWTILFRLCCCSTCTTPESWQRMISRSCSSISVIWRYTTPHWCLDS